MAEDMAQPHRSHGPSLTRATLATGQAYYCRPLDQHRDSDKPFQAMLLGTPSKSSSE